MSTKSRAPRTASSVAQPQQDQGTEGPQAQPMGNAAAQEQMGGAQAQGGLLDGAVDAVEGAIDAVIDWTWRQIQSADDLLTYAAEAGEDAAIVMIYQLVQHAPQVLEEFLEEALEVTELVWAAFEALADVALFLGLPEGMKGALFMEAVARRAHWLLDALAEIDTAELAALLLRLSEGDLELVMEVAEELFFAALDSVWEPGLGVTLEIEADVMVGVIGAEIGSSFTFRHQGRGAFECTRTMRGGVHGEPGAESSDQAEGLSVDLGLEGFLEETYEVPFLGFGLPALYAKLLQSGSAEGSALTLEDVLNVMDVSQFLTRFELGGGARIVGEVGADLGDSPMAMAMKAAASCKGKLSVAFEDIEPRSAHVEVKGRMEGLVSFGTELGVGDEVEASLGDLDQDMGLISEASLSFDLSVDRSKPMSEWVSDMVVSRTDTLDTGSTEIGLGVELAVVPELCTSVEDFLSRVQGLTLSATIGAADDLAETWLSAAGLAGTLGGGSWALSAEIALQVTLDAEAVQFIAQVVAQALAADAGEGGIVGALLAWAAAPLTTTPVEAVQLLAMELAMATDMSLVISGEATRSTEGSVGGGGLELDVGAGVTLDIEKDLLPLGASVTTDEIATVLTGDIDAGREREVAA